MRKQPIKYLICLISFFVMGLGTQARQAQGFEVNKNALVLLVAKDKSDEILGTGSGFIVKPEGTLITNYHVLVDAHSMDAVFTDGSRVPVSGIIHIDRKMDFALLQLGKGFYYCQSIIYIVNVSRKDGSLSQLRRDGCIFGLPSLRRP